MKPPDAFTSPIGPLLTRYLAVKRALGRRAVTTAYILRRLDRFLVSCHADELTRETFTAWGDSMTSLKASTRRAWFRSVYHFCLFRRRDDPHSFVPDPTQFPLRGPRPLPYIFSEADIVRLLTMAEGLAPHAGSPLHREVARLGIVVLYTTGLRRGSRATRTSWTRTPTKTSLRTAARSSTTSATSTPSSADSCATTPRR